MKLTPELVALIQYAASDDMHPDTGAATMYAHREAIAHDLALLARIQASLQGVGEVATRG